MPELTEQLIKAKSGEFDIALIKRLDMSASSLTRITNLSAAVDLVDLNLSNNQIAVMEGFSSLLNLRKLDISKNRITVIEGLGTLTALETLICKDNRIATTDALSGLAQAQSLKAVHFQAPNRSKGNPVCSEATYESEIVRFLPNLAILDGEHILLKSEASEAMNAPVKEELNIPASQRWCKDSIWEDENAQVSSQVDAAFNKKCQAVTDSLGELAQLDKEASDLMKPAS